ncbi:MAG: hypothetical protein WCT19_01530 [Candidatus Paceibacterota bacterium]|jgi:Ni,Fe-hydrogenase maturation factor
MNIIYIFGNEDLDEDSLPIRILPELRKEFPEIQFEIKDPNEEWENIGEELIIIDTSVGAKDVMVFDGLEKFARSPNVGMHDFDALTNLRYLQKLGKIKKVKIIGIPPETKKSEALEKTDKIITDLKFE